MSEGEPPKSGTAAPSSATLRIDVAEAAFRAARAKHVLRLHALWRPALPTSASFTSLLERATTPDNPPGSEELRTLMQEAARDLPTEEADLRGALDDFVSNGFVREPYPDRRGIVITGRKRLRSPDDPFLPALDEGDDDASRLGRERPVTLDDHTRHVREALANLLVLIRTNIRDQVYDLAAERHDWGKADDRFQALLRGTDRTDAWLFVGQSPTLLAKSDGMPRTPAERNKARERSGLPAGFRHEMLSVQLSEAAGIPPDFVAETELVLHLIASHHGYARPLAPVVLNDDPPDVQYKQVALASAERRQRPPHRLDSGIADRFWRLTRHYGWWGLAYLESLLRLADQQASADEDAGNYESNGTSKAHGATA